MLSFKSCIVLPLRFRYVTHVEFIFVNYRRLRPIIYIIYYIYLFIYYIYIYYIFYI